MCLNATGRQMKFDYQKSVHIFAPVNCFANVNYALKGVSSRYFSRPRKFFSVKVADAEVFGIIPAAFDSVA
jgi:hypothetical protein